MIPDIFALRRIALSWTKAPDTSHLALPNESVWHSILKDEKKKEKKKEKFGNKMRKKKPVILGWCHRKIDIDCRRMG